MATKYAQKRVAKKQPANRVRLTDRNVHTLPPAPNPHWDTLVTGFGLRVGAHARTYVVKFRIDGVQPTMRLGRVGVKSLADARQAARDALEQLDEGKDPRIDYAALAAAEAAEREAVVAAERARRSDQLGFTNFSNRYLRYQVPRKQRSERTRDETKRIIEKILQPKLGQKPLDAITPNDINQIIDPYLHAGQDIGARSVFERVRSVFKYALERGELTDSPIRNMTTPGEKIARDRWLDADEIKAVWNASTKVGHPFGDFIKLTLALGGQRRDDVAKLRRSQLTTMQLRHETDSKAKPETVQVWLMQAPTKSRNSDGTVRPHVVPLSTLARDLIAALPGHNGDYLLSTTGGELPFSSYSKCKERIDKALVDAKLPPWRVHDLRRTVSTHLAEALDQPPHVAEIIQNRRSGVISGVVQTYNRATYLRLKRDVLEQWGEYLRRIVA